MCAVSALRCAYKQALRSGRIYKQTWAVYDPTLDTMGIPTPYTDFSTFSGPMTEHRWNDFQTAERAFRETLDTKKLRQKQHFFSSADPGKWMRLISLLNGVFFRNGIFNGQSYGLPFLKYTARILKKLPVDKSLPEDLTTTSLASWIEIQLRFIRDIIQPSLGGAQSRQSRKVKRNKLSYLWQHRRTKAIQIILNNSEYPAPPPCSSNITHVQTYYENKCQGNGHTSSAAPLSPPPWSDMIPSSEPEHLPTTALFTEEEVKKVIDNLPNYKASGVDGVTYETIKSTNSYRSLTHIFNGCLENKRVPDSWKGALVHRIPKKDNIPDDPTTWRDISLLPTVYKVFMKCLLSRILPWLVENNILSTKQKAYIERQGMNEHTFCLKTGIDDFKHESSRFYAVFLDFRDAFGTLAHDIMFKSLEEIHLPQVYIDIVKDVYRDSFIQVICGKQLTGPIPLQLGIKTGCPWSAVNFVLAINGWLQWMCQCAPLNTYSPNPVQGYADDVVVCSRQEGVIKDMLSRTDSFLEWSGLQVKPSKCAVFYERRSGGNRWYHAKSDKIPTFTINNVPIRVFARHETYSYLGHKFNIAGEWTAQVNEIAAEYTARLDLINSSPLPLVMKLEAIGQIALSKIHHLFSNIHIPKKVLYDINNKTVQRVREWFGLSTHTTRDLIFHSKREGGLGVPDIEWTYLSTRLAHLLNMLNSDDRAVRELARASLILDLERRKVPKTSDSPSFLGFKKKPSGKLDTNATGFGVNSDWPDLNDLCNWTGVSLEWKNADNETVSVSESVITDLSIKVRATVSRDGTSSALPTTGARARLLAIKEQDRKRRWTGLRLQGKLACLASADHSVSHSILKNAAIDEDILIFTVKARLQVLPTKLNLSIWYPNRHDSYCLHHGQHQIIESMSHILNGCNVYKGLYIARHDRIVDIITKDVSPMFHSSAVFYKHSRVKPEMFQCNDSHVFANITADTPDVIVIDENSREVFLLEVGCAFDSSLEEAFPY